MIEVAESIVIGVLIIEVIYLHARQRQLRDDVFYFAHQLLEVVRATTELAKNYEPPTERRKEERVTH